MMENTRFFSDGSGMADPVMVMWTPMEVHMQTEEAPSFWRISLFFHYSFTIFATSDIALMTAFFPVQLGHFPFQFGHLVAK